MGAHTCNLLQYQSCDSDSGVVLVGGFASAAAYVCRIFIDFMHMYMYICLLMYIYIYIYITLHIHIYIYTHTQFSQFCIPGVALGVMLVTLGDLEDTFSDF